MIVQWTSLVLVILHVTSGRHIPCHRSTTEDAGVANMTGVHESFLMMPSFRQGRDVSMTSDGRKIPLLRNNEESNCEEVQYSGTNENIAVSCPWHYVLNVDSNREPERLIEAVCNCDGRECLHGPPNSRCLPVKYYIRVNRLVASEDGEAVFEPKVEPIVVGCTCAVPPNELDIPAQ